MSKLTDIEMGEIALRVMIATTPRVTGEGSAKREAELRADGVYYVVKETGVTNEKAMQFLQRLHGIASNLDEKEMEEIALKFMKQRVQRYLKNRNVDRFGQVIAERTGIPCGLLMRFTHQLLLS